MNNMNRTNPIRHITTARPRNTRNRHRMLSTPLQRTLRRQTRKEIIRHLRRHQMSRINPRLTTNPPRRVSRTLTQVNSTINLTSRTLLITNLPTPRNNFRRNVTQNRIPMRTTLNRTRPTHRQLSHRHNSTLLNSRIRHNLSPNVNQRPTTLTQNNNQHDKDKDNRSTNNNNRGSVHCHVSDSGRTLPCYTM